MTAPEAIRMEAVSKTYRVSSLIPGRPARRVEALRDVSLVCPHNEVSCVLGPNGAGKTTLLKVLAGLVIADRGSLVLDGTPLESFGARLPEIVGIATPNERSFSLRLSGRHNLEFFAALHGLRGRERAERVREVLDLAGMDRDTADKECMRYSSGMKQKLLIARALLARPPILLLDEPTARLDPLARRAVHDLVRGLVEKRGVTVLLCTHDLSEAQTLARHLVLLNAGSVLAAGTIRDLRSLLPQVRGVVLEFDQPPRKAWLDALPPGCIAGADDHRVEVSVPGDDSLIPRIIEAAVSNGGRLLSCTRAEPSLIDVLTHVTEKAG